MNSVEYYHTASYINASISHTMYVLHHVCASPCMCFTVEIKRVTTSNREAVNTIFYSLLVRFDEGIEIRSSDCKADA